MKKTRKYQFLVMTLLLLLGSACGGGGDQVSDADAVLTQAAEIAAQAQTQTAEAVPPATDTPLPVPTDTPTLQPVIAPTQGLVPTNASSLTDVPAAGITAGAPTQVIFPPTSTVVVNNQPAAGDCYKAAFESDGTPYDGTAITGAKTFTKHWRIKNIGTCEWTSEGVFLKWLGTEKKELNQPWESNVAEIFGQGSVIPIVTETVYPGEHLDIAVDFIVPVPRTTKIEWKAYFCLGTPGGLVYFNGGTIWFWIVATNPD